MPEGARAGLGVDDIAGDWRTLEQLWQRVTTDDATIEAHAGGWLVRKERADRELPVPVGPAADAAIYITARNRKRQVARYALAELAADPERGRDA